MRSKTHQDAPRNQAEIFCYSEHLRRPIPSPDSDIGLQIYRATSLLIKRIIYNAIA
ncbi:hypothetical protein A359_04210 [secondary endosymbiont of Ctenarytaina eucalypti]|uniref:Uncharacterized protein n=1 Tax=secondary endosymbiont of Ctenarytaina eucalypti TaxID=1199245 RepID=J3Z3J8_9ENTR|nr:hypothetical protein A359_04210 [secondary endosymbiont of Ctenarytaina eucalypti]